MVEIVKIIGVFGLFIGILYLISIGASHSSPTSTLQQIYSATTFPTGDQMIFYKQAQQVYANAAQLSAQPDQALKLLGFDEHKDVIAQNTTTGAIVNATSGSQEANKIIAISNSTTSSNAGSYVTVSGESYNTNTGATLATPIVTEQCHLGQICPIGGKVVMADPNSCHVETINGQTQNVCNYVQGPFKFMLQIICVDTNPYRCSYLSDRLPTDGSGMTATTQQDGTWSYDWTVGGDQYFLGNYIARMTIESETSGVNGLLVTQTGDYPVSVVN